MSDDLNLDLPTGLGELLKQISLVIAKGAAPSRRRGPKDCVHHDGLGGADAAPLRELSCHHVRLPRLRRISSFRWTLAPRAFV